MDKYAVLIEIGDLWQPSYVQVMIMLLSLNP